MRETTQPSELPSPGLLLLAPRSAERTMFPPAPNSHAHVPGISVCHPHVGAHQFHRLVLATMLCQELLHLSLVVLFLGGGGREGEDEETGAASGTIAPSANSGCLPPFLAHPGPPAFLNSDLCPCHTFCLECPSLAILDHPPLTKPCPLASEEPLAPGQHPNPKGPTSRVVDYAGLGCGPVICFVTKHSR